MSTRVYSVTPETTEEVIALLQKNLLEKEMFFQGISLFTGGYTDLGCALFRVESVKKVENVAIVVSYRFILDTEKHLRHYLLPIIQPKVPNFNLSTLSIQEGKIIVLNVHVSKPFDLLNKYGFNYGFLPYGFSMCRFILDPSLNPV